MMRYKFVNILLFLFMLLALPLRIKAGENYLSDIEAFRQRIIKIDERIKEATEEFDKINEESADERLRQLESYIAVIENISNELEDDGMIWVELQRIIEQGKELKKMLSAQSSDASTTAETRLEYTRQLRAIEDEINKLLNLKDRIAHERGLLRGTIKSFKDHKEFVVDMLHIDHTQAALDELTKVQSEIRSLSGKIDIVLNTVIEPLQKEKPEFPWPPPKASANVVIPFDMITKTINLPANINNVLQRFQNALDTCGYVEQGYYAVPDGFALVTRLEQIHSDGTPKEASERWTVEIPPLRKFSLQEYLQALFSARKGYYRIIVFIFTVHPFSQSNVSLTSEEAEVWLSHGLNMLPQEIGQQEYTNEYSCTALIYEFEQIGFGETPNIKIPGRLSGKTHLIKAELWKTLEK